MRPHVHVLCMCQQAVTAIHAVSDMQNNNADNHTSSQNLRNLDRGQVRIQEFGNPSTEERVQLHNCTIVTPGSAPEVEFAMMNITLESMLRRNMLLPLFFM